MTDAQLESLAIRAARGNNGGEWQRITPKIRRTIGEGLSWT